VDLVSGLNFKKLKTRIVAKARKRMMLVDGDEKWGVACGALLPSLECTCEACA